MDRINVACMGYGFAGRSFHSYLISLVPRMHLRGIASRNPQTREKIVAERGCIAYESFEQVLADDQVDLVVLATPHDVHAEQAIAAMRAGKHVVTDKVMCLNLDECDRMIATARETRRLLSVFHNRRWDGDFLTLRQLMRDSTLGDVKWIEMAWGRFGPPRGWRGQRAHGGGRLYDLGAHMLDQMLLLFPRPVQSVYCRMHHDFAESDVESHAMVVMHFADGATGVVDASSIDRIPKPRFRVRGMKATLVKYGVDPQEAAMIAGNIDSAAEDPKNHATLNDGQREWTVPTLPGRWRSFYENIADVLLDGREPAIKLDEMRRLMAVMDAARQSAQTGQIVQPAQ